MSDLDRKVLVQTRVTRSEKAAFTRHCKALGMGPYAVLALLVTQFNRNPKITLERTPDDQRTNESNGEESHVCECPNCRRTREPEAPDR